jgi:Transposase, Mutator family
VADHIEECLTCLAFPEPHRRRIRTTNDPERFNQELKRRMRVVRSFPNREACLRLVTALAELTLYTAWDASDTIQMDYKWTILYARWLFMGSSALLLSDLLMLAGKVAQRFLRETLAPLHNAKRGRRGNEIRSLVIRSNPCDAPGIRWSGVSR